MLILYGAHVLYVAHVLYDAVLCVAHVLLYHSHLLSIVTPHLTSDVMGDGKSVHDEIQIAEIFLLGIHLVQCWNCPQSLCE